MKVSYGVKFPRETKNMGEYVKALYKFYDSQETSACFECDSAEEAVKCYKNIYGAIWRGELPVALKRIDSNVYLEKVVRNG